MSQKLQRGNVAPAGIVLNIHEEPIDLHALWQDGPTLLTFLRHFG